MKVGAINAGIPEPAELIFHTCIRCGDEFKAGRGVIRCPRCSDPTLRGTGYKRPTLGEVLTARERQLVPLVAEGLSNKDIGGRLHITEGTVKVYLARIFAKTGATNRTHLAVRYRREITAEIEARLAAYEASERKVEDRRGDRQPAD